MIEPEQYVLPHKEHKHERTEDEIEASRKLEDELYAMNFRPLGVEW